MLEWIYLLQNRIYFVLFEDIFLLSEKYYSYCVNQTHICYLPSKICVFIERIYDFISYLCSVEVQLTK